MDRFNYLVYFLISLKRLWLMVNIRSCFNYKFNASAQEEVISVNAKRLLIVQC